MKKIVLSERINKKTGVICLWHVREECILNYIIFDLELNSKPFKNRHPNEIIEIGAVKLSDKLEKTGEFQEFIKPRIYKKLFSVIKRKTCIQQEDIQNAEDFKKVLSRFKSWIGEEQFILCSWGHDDIHNLKTNCEFNKLGVRWLKKSLDIQNHFSKIYNLPKGHNYSLKDALKILNIPMESNLHRADIDAEYTSEIFIKIFDKIEIIHDHHPEQVV